MKIHPLILSGSCAALSLLLHTQTFAGTVISSATEPNGGEVEGIFVTGDIISPHADGNVPDPYTVPVFSEDAVAFTDRDHEYNGVNAAGIPVILDGGDYIMTANDARDNNPYSIEFTTIENSRVYVLFDDRYTPPAWFTDGTGIDLTDTGADIGIDEDGIANGTVGAGQGINRPHSIWIAADMGNGGTSILAPGTYTVFERGDTGGNMYGVVAKSSEIPIQDFVGVDIDYGESADLSWIIATGATSASIDNSVGDILPNTTDGIGSISVSPDKTTTYTLTVDSPNGMMTAQVTVNVNLIKAFSGSPAFVADGESSLLSWQSSPLATRTISGIGNVDGDTDANGDGMIPVTPAVSTIYTLDATIDAETTSTDAMVWVSPVSGESVGMIDIGALNGTPETGVLGGMQIGAGDHNVNGPEITTPVSLSGQNGAAVSIAIDNLAPDGSPVGRLDWRDRGTSPDVMLGQVAEDFVKNNGGMIRVSLTLPLGEYSATSFHTDPGFSQCEAISVIVTDAEETERLTGALGSAFVNPAVGAITTADVEATSATFSFISSGIDPVIIYFDGRLATDTETPLSGLFITKTGDIELEDPISGFASAQSTISFGNSTSLSWLISSDATLGEIDNSIGNILPSTTDGAGSVSVSPAVTTTYTLTVESPAGNDTASVTVTVSMLDSFTSDVTAANEGDPVTLSWKVRPDASVTISGIGDVTANTNASTGLGSIVVMPAITTSYEITATSGGETESGELTVNVLPTGYRFALIDLGGNGGQEEPGAVEDLSGTAQIGEATDANGVNLLPRTLVSEDNRQFTIAIDNLDPAGIPVGNIDWRDRGDAAAGPLNFLAEDFLKNNAGMIRVSLGQLPPGDYTVVSYHLDSDNSQSEQMKILVSDDNGTAVEQVAVGNASYPGHPGNGGAPGIGGLSESVANEHFTSFTFTADGSSDVIIYFDSTAAPIDTEGPLNGLILYGPPPEDPVEITRVYPFNTATRTMSFDFSSKTGATYLIEVSSDLVIFETLELSYPSGGTETNYTEIGIPVQETQRYYRVSEN